MQLKFKPYGIDYASIDGNKSPDIAASTADGNTFVIQRASGDGFRPVEDPHFDRDRASWNKAGVPFGGYLIQCWPTKRTAAASPQAQAQQFIDTYGARRTGEFCPWLDVEFGAVGGRTGSVLSARQAVEHIETVYDALVRVYGVVGVYTSNRVWRDDLLGWKSEKLANAPLWIKTGYMHDRLHPPDTTHFIGYDPKDPSKTPVPWRGEGPGVWINQIQGDAKGSVGFTSTTDINLFLYMKKGEKSNRVKWVQKLLGAEPDGDFGPKTETLVKEFQCLTRNTSDGVVGPKTFVALCAAKSAEVLKNL